MVHLLDNEQKFCQILLVFYKSNGSNLTQLSCFGFRIFLSWQKIFNYLIIILFFFQFCKKRSIKYKSLYFFKVKIEKKNPIHRTEKFQKVPAYSNFKVQNKQIHSSAWISYTKWMWIISFWILKNFLKLKILKKIGFKPVPSGCFLSNNFRKVYTFERPLNYR